VLGLRRLMCGSGYALQINQIIFFRVMPEKITGIAWKKKTKGRI